MDSGVATSNEMLLHEFSVVHGAPLPYDIPPTLHNLQRAHYEEQAAALCLSGGGIRSAAFCLGVVHALARRGILKRFHYLSSVSGGGYTGSLLSAWTYRAGGGIKDVEAGLNRREAPETQRDLEEDPLRWLRRFSSYLSPRYGLRSTDTWTLAAIYLRNLLLNWLVLVPCLFAFVCAIFFFAALFFEPSRTQNTEFIRAAFVAGFGFTGLGIFLLRLRLFFFRGQNEIRGLGLHRVVVSVMGLGAIFLAASMSGESQLQASSFSYEFAGYLAGTAMGVAAMLVVADVFRTRRIRFPLLFGLVLATVLTALAGLIWFVLIRSAHETGVWGLAGSVSDGWRIDEHAVAYRSLIVFGPPAWLLCIALPEALFVGVVARLGDDNDREWWARSIAFLFVVATTWIILGAVALFGPLVLGWVWKLISPHITLGAAIAALLTLGGLITRRGFKRAFAQEDADVPKGTSLLNYLGHLGLNVAAAVLIVILFSAIAAVVESLQVWLASAHQVGVLGRIFGEHTVHTLLLCIGFSAVAFIFGYFVDVNRFSLHGMYRDRLSRAFLAASRWQRVPPSAYGIQRDSVELLQFQKRREDRFTQFDRHDSPLLSWLDPSRRQGIRLPGDVRVPADEQTPGPVPVNEFVRAPLHVINCALNLVGDRDKTELQERKAASFTFSPLHAGSHGTGYRSSAAYGGANGLSLGTAMTISGAAVSPNAGQHSTAIMAFIMTFFNARLGWWLGNPGKPTSLQEGPNVSTTFLLRELFGLTQGAGDWVFLSDGGHFDNLGLYEMVRRGCRYIVAVDAGADPDRTFEDLGNAIRKIRIDFGIEIQRRDRLLIGGRDRGSEGRYAALFDIVYPHLKGKERPGMLIYIKPSIYRAAPQGAPLDCVEYGSRSDTFPHEPTSDQFYLESQFESYRALGEHEADEILHGFAWSVPEIAESVKAHIGKPFQRLT